jgi:hypothetical protein
MNDKTKHFISILLHKNCVIIDFCMNLNNLKDIFLKNKENISNSIQ